MVEVLVRNDDGDGCEFAAFTVRSDGTIKLDGKVIPSGPVLAFTTR
jgi:hypothetical protein